MKVTDLRRKLIAALVAAGTLVPVGAYAANFNQNLVVNGDFETVDLNTTNVLHSPLILNWNSVIGGYAYSHNGSSSSAGVVPNFANGTAPPNAGNWYLTTNRPGGPELDRIDAPGEFYQDIDVSAGDTGAFINAGTVQLGMSAYMSTYANDADYGNVHALFLSRTGATLGSAVMSDSDVTQKVNGVVVGPVNVWSPNSLNVAVPAGTTKVRLSIYGTKEPGISAGADGYVDNVTAQLKFNSPELALLVNRANGNITLKNLSGASVNISSYSITSAFESMSTTNWLPIADNYDNGNPGPNQVDANHSWTKLTAAGAHTDLSEVDFQSGLGASITNNQTVNLGNGDWIQNPNEDLVFKYISNGVIHTGVVGYTGNNGVAFASGDLNADGVINSADWNILRSNQLGNLSSLSLAQAYRLGDLNGDKLSDHADFIAFKAAYDAVNGSGSFLAMVASVPEPTTSLLIFAAGSIALPVVRRRGGLA
jgi:hypothetical protein